MRVRNYHHLGSTRLSAQAYIQESTATEQENSKDGWETMCIKYASALNFKGAQQNYK